MKLELTIPEDQLAPKLQEAIQILLKLEYYKQKWEREYGAINRNILRTWEQRQSAFLRSLNIKPIVDGTEPEKSDKVD